MSKKRARGEESYAAEERFHASAVATVERAGFRDVRARKVGAVKIIDGVARDGARVTFWLKLGWSGVPYAAVQFGLFKGPGGARKSDREFVSFVQERVERMKGRGITHALLVHRDTSELALKLEDVVPVYAEQMRRFPGIARNTKSPTMWFFDPRPNGHAEVAAIVLGRAIPLDEVAARGAASPEDAQVRSKMAEVEMRMMQATFRHRVGERCQWKCAVTGCAIAEILDSAHLPGRDWRRHNEATDGVLLRADIHRLLDRGLARIVDGRFVVTEEVAAEYAAFHGKVISL